MLQKQYSPDGAVCRVTFVLTDSVNARTACVVGEFNQWRPNATLMIQLENGTWVADVNLEAGREYQYRFLVNGDIWLNDPNADRYVSHIYGGENSVVVT